MNRLKFIGSFLVVLIMSGCGSTIPSHDYSNFREADPHSILVLPPVNNTPEVIAPYSVMSRVIAPIAESGYYVFPVALVDQTFKNNGLSQATEIHQLPLTKLNDVFGADAALYMTIEKYGTNYVVIDSDTRVSVSAKLVDLHSGIVLWEDSASASSSETRSNSNSGGLLGALIEAALVQIIETVSDQGFQIAEITTNRLLSADGYNGLLYGPRSPKYGQPVPSETQK